MEHGKAHGKIYRNHHGAPYVLAVYEFFDEVSARFSHSTPASCL